MSGWIPGRSKADRRRALWTGALLLCLLLAGGWLRFNGLNWDDYTFLHPDERFLTDVAARLGGGLQSTRSGGAEAQQAQLAACLARHPQGGAGPYFDTECSPLNPHNVGVGMYVYGTLPLFLARATGELLAQVSGDSVHSGFFGLHLVWRGLSALAETAIILVVYLIGVTLHERRTALLAAALYAAVVLSIQQAHYGTVDAMTNLCCALGLLFAARAQRAGRLADYALFGLVCGCALAGRINVAPLAGLIVLVAALRAWPALQQRAAGRSLLRRDGGGLLLAGGLALLTFRILNPYAFSGPGFFGLAPNPRWLADLATARDLVNGQVEFPPNWQWVARARWLFPLNNILLWGLGPALGLAAVAGTLAAGLRLLQRRQESRRNLLPVLWVLGYFALLGGGWVTSMRYFLPLYPALALLAAWGLGQLLRWGRRAGRRRGLAWTVTAVVLVGSGLWAVMFSNIYRHQLTRVQASHWFWERVPGDFALPLEDTAGNPPLINIAVDNRGDHGGLIERASRYETGRPFSHIIRAPAAGRVTEVLIPHLGDPLADPAAETLRITLTDLDDGALLAEAQLSADLARAGEAPWDARALPLQPALSLEAGQELLFTFEVLAGGPVVTGGSLVAYEGDWDDAVPWRTCTLPPGVTLADDPPPGLLHAGNCHSRDAWRGLLLGIDMGLAGEDDEALRQRLLYALHHSDYLTISSNRFYDTKTRNPLRWPLSVRYYRALFAGELGFEPVAQFDESFELGPLRIADQHLPTWDSPAWLNEFEAEEAFHVYDHPAVFVFAKRPDYDPAATEALLGAPPLHTLSARGSGLVADCPALFRSAGGGGCDTTLVDTLRRSSLEAGANPAWLLLDEERRAQQVAGGGWRERFDRDSLLNSVPLLTVAGWWLTVAGFGLAAWPWLYLLFPGMGARGFCFARLVGLLLVAWMAWAGSSAGLPLWRQGGIALLLLLLLAGGLLLLRGPARGFRRWLGEHWRRLLVLEGALLLLFLGFLLVRLSNGDLWHPAFGGEKPMDFAYFNAVLRSSSFPPYDPWYAGGYLNYYYFGFVLVGAPVLLSGIQPSLAYNLIVPTLFALTGMGAFAVAFNLVQRQRGAGEAAATRAGRGAASPWVAGCAALLLAVLLGNLDTLRVFGNSLAALGGYAQPQGLAEFLIEEFTLEHGVAPPAIEAQELLASARENRLPDRLRYEMRNALGLWSGLLHGATRWLAGEALPLASHRWYWAPTRVLAETPGVAGNAITEMPWFTFLYGDLHAHMIAMPLQLLVIAFVVHELQAAGRDGRSARQRWAALALGALAAGMLRATNTWDWPTYTLLGVAGLGGAWWLGRRSGQPHPWWSLPARTGGFVLAGALFALPYTHWYATGYSSVRLWQGGRTPLWAWLDIHGLFVFLLLSLLLWDTARWFRATQVRQLRGQARRLGRLGLVILLVTGLGVALALAGWQVALPVLPLLLWSAILMLRPGQTRALQLTLGLAAVALALTLGVEFLVLDGDIGRQNTVFKFYLQAWLLFSVAGGAGCAWLLAGLPRWPVLLRLGWALPAAPLFLGAALYPLLSTPARALDRMAPEVGFTLDGMAYMRNATYHENGVTLQLADDYALIRWLQDNVAGAPVILEAQGWREYLWSGRVSMHTGLPTPLGWRNHQRQQRTLAQQGAFIDQRRANIHALYSTDDSELAWKMLRFYQVRYVIVSGLERAWYPAAGLEKFGRMVSQGRLDKVFEQGGAVIYEVRESAA